MLLLQDQVMEHKYLSVMEHNYPAVTVTLLPGQEERNKANNDSTIIQLLL